MYGNLISKARIFQRKESNRTWYTRQDKIKRDGSEYFTWQVPSTAAAATSQIEIKNQFPRAGKYMPLDYMEIANNDTVNLTLTINGAETLPVPAGTIRKVENKALWQIAVTNNDAAAASTLNLITVSLRRLPVTIDDWARGQ